jgi:hypothetical protein
VTGLLPDNADAAGRDAVETIQRREPANPGSWHGRTPNQLNCFVLPPMAALSFVTIGLFVGA